MKKNFLQNLTVGRIATTMILIFFAVGTLTMQSCATAKIPSDVSSAITKLGTDLPRLMGQATNAYNPQMGEQAQAAIRDIRRAADSAQANKKFKKVGDMLNALVDNNVQPYMDSWKMKGKLEPNTVTSGIREVNEALTAIRKQAKMN